MPADRCGRQLAASGSTSPPAAPSPKGCRPPRLFPPMLVQMVAVGEQTGKLDEVLHRLADHYEHLASMRRMFWIGIAWPLFELCLRGAADWPGDLHHWDYQRSATGGRRARYSAAWDWSAPAGPSCGSSFVAFAREPGSLLPRHALAPGWLGPQPMLVAMRIPVLGKCLESLAAVAADMVVGNGARQRHGRPPRAVTLSIRSAQNPYYESSLPRVAAGDSRQPPIPRELCRWRRLSHRLPAAA